MPILKRTDYNCLKSSIQLQLVIKLIHSIEVISIKMFIPVQKCKKLVFQFNLMHYSNVLNQHQILKIHFGIMLSRFISMMMKF